MSKRTIAIGDIHGCAKALARILEAIQPTSADTLVTLGDYVDRGPDSSQVLDQLVDLLGRCELIPLLGNHEAMMLDASDSRDVKEFWLSCGGQETLDSYGGSLRNVPQDHWVFLHGLTRYYQTASHVFVHANYKPELPWDQQPDTCLLWQHLARTSPRPHHSGKVVVVGHTPQASGEVLNLGHVICIDTYCVGGGWLTALDVESGWIWQADRNGTLRDQASSGSLC